MNGELKFEGEYLNGKRHGKGKEYLNGILIYEDEYLNGQRNGKGKEFYDKGKLKFEGEYKFGKKWNGKGYDTLNNILYELKDGKGVIKEYNHYIHKLLFETDYLNGQRNGKGKEYLNGILIYEGEYLNGQRNGKGKEYYSYNGELMFEGEYLYNYKIKGKFYLNNKLEYEGEYLYNKKWNGKGYDEKGNIIYELINNGKVKEYYELGDLLFEGEYLNGKRSGMEKNMMKIVIQYVTVNI